MNWKVFVPWLLFACAGLLFGLLHLSQIPNAIMAMDLASITRHTLIGGGSAIVGCIAALLLVKRL